LNLQVIAGNLGAEIKITAIRAGPLQFIQILPITDGDMLPVIQAGPLQIAVIRGKPQLAYQVQVGAGGGT